MANNTELSDEIVFASSDSNVSRMINQVEKEGKLRKIAPRNLYHKFAGFGGVYHQTTFFLIYSNGVSQRQLLATAVHQN